MKIVLLVLFPYFLWSQSSQKIIQTDSYEDLKQAFINSHGNDKKQLLYANAYIKRAQIQKSNINLARGYFLLSNLFEGAKCIQYLDISIKYAKNTDDIKFPALSYSKKGYELKKQFRFNEALANFFMADKYAKRNNLDFYYNIKHSIGMLRSEELGQVEEALVLYRECFNYYKGKDVRSPKYATEYHNVLFALADAHKSLKNLDSTSFYNNMGYIESKATNDKYYISYFILNEGANQVLKRNYNAALDSINKALAKILLDKNDGNILAAYFYLGKSYDGIGNEKKAVQNYIKVDSMYMINKRIIPEFIGGYSYLIEHYKQTGDKLQQLKFLNKFTKIDSVLQTDYKQLSKVLLKDYDTPHLFAKKESLIQSLQKKESTYFFIILILIVGLSGLMGYQYFLKKQYRKRFDAILHNDTTTEVSSITPKKSDSASAENRMQEKQELPAEVVQMLIEKLAQFELKKGFLENNITIQKVALELNTNIKYLSKVINEQKRKTFIHYINELRINEAVVQLQAQSILRNYNMPSLANEFGFNSAEAFSAAFYKKHKIKPTFFIKTLEKEK
ncbi:AraC family transcriptional regulator [Flavobacterium sp. PL12]|uniref:helix-turn-helix domain-containing protein n=1 Tax=Flavobacterium sp. PL12 TaxID=3071718 RepID=UPI00319E532F